jgi:hypothetical protein
MGDDPADVATVTLRAVETVTMLVTVAVFVDALAPVVGAEVSVTVAESVKVPAVVGSHVIEKGDTPAAVPMFTPLAKNCTDTIEAPPVGAALTVTVTPAGVLTVPRLAPLIGVTNEIVGVAQAIWPASSAAVAAIARRGHARTETTDLAGARLTARGARGPPAT